MGGGGMNEDRKHPLQLVFEVREGGVVSEDRKHPSDSHLKRGRGNRVVTGWVETKNAPPTCI